MGEQQIALLQGQRGFVFYSCFIHLSFNCKETGESSLKPCSGLAVSERRELRKQSQVKKKKKKEKRLQMVLKCK